MSKQLKLNQFFTGTSKRNQDESSTAKTSGSDNDQDSLTDECCEPEKKKTRKLVRKFNVAWQTQFSWLQQSETGGMQCKVCIKAHSSNSFTTDEGVTNYQMSNLVRHQTTQQHLTSLQKIQMQAEL